MTTTTMQFGPEWMRTKHQTPRSQAAPSPPPVTTALPAASSYSSLVTPVSNVTEEKRDVSNPFRYSKEEMFRIYKEGGGRGGLGLEVERWEGIVREMGSDPVGLKELSENERKLFAGPLNSEIRRRQSTDYLSPLATPSERPRLPHANTAGGSPMRERFTLVGRRRDSTDQQPSIPRKLSTSALHGQLNSPRESGLPSPRPRVGFSSGFDGVLNGGDSWSLRRRASEGLVKSHSDSPSDRKGHDIKEEEESGNIDPHHLGNGSGVDDSDPSSSQHLLPNAPHTTTPMDDSFGGGLAQNVGTLSLAENPGAGQTVDPSGGTPDPDRANGDHSPGSLDLGAVQWSYLDPQGQIQGPFRGDLMQKWHDEGYFTPDLLMKRTHLDSEWVSVGEMSLRAGTDKIFLSPALLSSGPPGLSRHSHSPHDGMAQIQEPSVTAAAYQLAPNRALRSSTLDSYLSNPSPASVSPASSFGAARFGNASPDAAAFGGRSNSLYAGGDSSLGARMLNVASANESYAPYDTQGRGGYGTSPLTPSYPSRQSFPENITPGRAHPAEGFGYEAHITRGATDTLGGLNTSFVSPEPDVTFGTMGPKPAYTGPASGYSGSEYGPVGAQFAQRTPVRTPRDSFPRHGHEDRLESSTGYLNGPISPFGAPAGPQAFPQSPHAQYLSPQPRQTLPTLTTTTGSQPIATISPILSHAPPQNMQHSFLSTPNQVAQPAWPAQDPTPVRRAGPFDPPLPKTTNTVINPNQPPAPSHIAPRPPVPQPQSSAPVPNGQSHWLTASQGIVDDGWGEAPGGPNSLTYSNLMQHNEQLQRQKETAPLLHESPEHSEGPEPAPQPVEVPSPPVAPAVAKPAAADKPQKVETKHQPQVVKQPAPIVPVQPPRSLTPPVVSPIPVSQGPPKAPWATEDEKKGKVSATSMNLRDIQEAEEKRLEAKKAAERERDRAVRAAPVEDAQPFTASWGLPTSQAGASRANSHLISKDAPTATSQGAANTTGAPWTQAAKPPTHKKTMKEIQEEEERRKKESAKQKDTVAAAARRAYAETTTKNPAPTTPTLGGVWTTVGPGGKSPAVTAPPARPAAPLAASSIITSTVPAPRPPNGPSPVRSTPVPPAVIKSVPSASKVDDYPTAPSGDFMRWVNESLKGLSSNVKVEEIMEILLSMPLDPDPSMVEIISTIIYQNSTTMDGRRFASEFITKRKSDSVASRSRTGASNGATGSASKTPSVAEVLKSQPKPAPNDGWGGFKVVNKKKKNGRS
ncbi:hypothetical protein JAAARDRAFT_160210 [Jaapia argillacea MUCL 33604]|uniref:GYF domain-containing protein n=1 Tax=Jaapia argillacea MUCL 33604 TaxID=933084 RepID=A0A067PX46_9AGAM|nr:hypothetical protein JAAARDRAFT_160210 [Jaapia argillacea MUCL 33604]